MQKNNYDVVIVGGGTSGCSCAWNCSRLGLKTLLIEKKAFLGGAITSQLVIPAMNTNHMDYNNLFYSELCKISHKEKAQITYKDGNPGWFNPLKLPQILYSMLSDVGCDILFSSEVLDIVKDDCIDKKYIDNSMYKQKILSIDIDSKHNDKNSLSICNDTIYIDNIADEKKQKKIKIFSKYFIDATGDADFSKICGAQFLPKETFQAMSLRFIMHNVDKESFAEWILAFDANRNVTTVADINGEIHLSTAYTWDIGQNWALAPLFDVAVHNGVLKDTDRAYFQLFSIAGEDDKIAFNCPRIMTEAHLNPLDDNDIIMAKKLGTEAIERIGRFCNKYLKGFENAEIFKIAEDVGVRESRRVKGKYILTKEDIYNATQFKNPVAYSNYPIDVHSIKKDESVLNYVQKTYSVPLESLIAYGFENLFVIGRCLSADFYAQAAVRIQPTCFSMGEGLAKYLSLL